jgi:hypothetical protein
VITMTSTPLARARAHAVIVVDLVAFVPSLLVLVALLVPPASTALPARPLMALVAVAFAPGWAVLRWFGAPLRVLTVVAAFALSVATVMIVSLATVAWLDWNWRPIAIAWSALTVAGLIVPAVRDMTTLPPGSDARDAEVPTLDEPLARSTVHADRAKRDVDSDVTTVWNLDWMLTAIGLLICTASVARTDVDDIDGRGLYSAVPLWFYAGIVLLLCALVRGLDRGDRRGQLAALANLGCLIVLTHGLPGLIESNPRFPVAWLHAGFADHIAWEGELLPRLDARFSWPGFFTGAAFLERIAGTETIRWALRFAPVVFNAIAAAVVYALGRSVGTSVRRSIVASTIFVFGNWIGQDYFAPQAIGFLLEMTVIVTVLTFFPARATTGGWIDRTIGPGEEIEPASTGDRSTLVYGACVLVAAAVIVSHQLSPPMLVAALLMLTLAGRIATRMLGWIVALGFVMWMSHAAEVYWVGHLDQLLEGVGDVQSVLRSNVSDRAGRATGDRQLVVRTRIGFMLMIWVAGALAILVQHRRRRLDPALLALFVAPFAILPLQSYGGEVLLRIAYFTLPATCVLIAGTRWPLLERFRVPRLAVGVVALALATPVLVVARFGNESYEQVSEDDRRVVEAMYRIVPDGALIFVPNRASLAYIDRIDEVHFRDIPSRASGARPQLRQADLADSVFVLITEAHEAYREQVRGAPPGWGQELADDLVARGWARVVARSGDSILLESIGG